MFVLYSSWDQLTFVHFPRRFLFFFFICRSSSSVEKVTWQGEDHRVVVLPADAVQCLHVSQVQSRRGFYNLSSCSQVLCSFCLPRCLDGLCSSLPSCLGLRSHRSLKLDRQSGVLNLKPFHLYSPRLSCLVEEKLNRTRDAVSVAQDFMKVLRSKNRRENRLREK